MTNRIVLRFQHRLAAGAAFLLLGLAVSAQTPAAAVPSTPPAVWTTYTYAAEGFSASFPAEPTLSKQNVPTDAGSFELRSYIVDLGSTALFVGVCDYGAAIAGHDPQTSLKGAENGALANSKSHMISEQKITLGIYPGLEFDSESDAAHFSARIYLVGTTLYQVLTVAPLTDRYADSSRFLDSFTIIPRTAN
ncbi:MAG TPA: hypothetical protein VMW15_13830 [Terracidiphilus sp.]|nr:hypothetical protein [Terracidiphilus sp.]